MTWKDVTYNQFMRLKEITETVSEDLQMLEIVLLFYGDVPLTEMWKYTNEVNNLLLQPLPSGDTIENTLEINGHKYTVTKDLGKITTAQFLDYVNIVKEKGNLLDILSCFIIPKGYKYGDDYDIEKVKKDLGELPFPTVQSYCFFFRKKWMKLQKISLLYLMGETMKLKGMSWKNKWKMLKAQATLWINMDSLITSSQLFISRD